MRAARFCPVVALFLAGQAFGLATVIYTLELGGGSPTYWAKWKNPFPGCQPELFGPGSTADHQQFCDRTITWAVRMAVTGTHSNGFVPSGIAGAAFDIEFTDGAGNPVPNFGKGSVSTPGFYSAINDGTTRSGCFSTTDPDELAAFTVGFDAINPPNNGRAVDDFLSGGPGMSLYQYPSTLGFPAGSTAASGTLTGFFLGYAQFSGSGCPGDCGFGPGLQTAGVGWSMLGEANCSTALGTQAVVEGQINISWLPQGNYRLRVIPRPGTTLLNGNFVCQFGESGAFIEPDAVVGSTVFLTRPFCDCGGRVVVGRYIFYNNSFYDTPSTGSNGCNTIAGSGAPCDDNSARSTTRTALLPTQTPHTPAPVGELGGDLVANYSSYDKGINGIMIDLQYTGGPGCALPAGTLSAPQVAAAFEFVESSTRSVTSAYTGTNRTTSATVSIAPHPTLANTDRITIIFPDNTSTNTRWLRTRLLTAGILADLIPSANCAPDGDRFYFGLAKAESLSITAGVPQVTSVDQNDVKRFPHTALNRANIESRVDFNKDALVTSVDQNLVKTNPATGLSGLLLAGTAP